MVPMVSSSEVVTKGKGIFQTSPTGFVGNLQALSRLGVTSLDDRKAGYMEDMKTASIDTPMENITIVEE